jgi:hypothetical protein
MHGPEALDRDVLLVRELEALDRDILRMALPSPTTYDMSGAGRRCSCLCRMRPLLADGPCSLSPRSATQSKALLRFKLRAARQERRS